MGNATLPQAEFPLHTTEEAAHISSSDANGLESHYTETRKSSA
jgi:hypothetical protein